MGVLDDLVQLVLPAAETPIRSVAVGIHYTAVCSLGAGLAATDRNASRTDGPMGPWLGRLDEMRAGELLPFLRSEHALERTLAMATLNSLIDVPSDAIAVPDGHSLVIERARGRRVVLVGRFAFAAAIREVAREVTILELEPRPGERPAVDAPAILEAADVVAVTGTTLVNGTFDGLVPHFAPGATVIMLGPTTPMSPVLFDHRVDVVAGMVVDDPVRLVAAVSQGGSRRQLHGTRPVVLARSGALLDG